VTMLAIEMKVAVGDFEVDAADQCGLRREKGRVGGLTSLADVAGK
jgi:hypothetical protein